MATPPCKSDHLTHFITFHGSFKGSFLIVTDCYLTSMQSDLTEVSDDVTPPSSSTRRQTVRVWWTNIQQTLFLSLTGSQMYKYDNTNVKMSSEAWTGWCANHELRTFSVWLFLSSVIKQKYTLWKHTLREKHKSWTRYQHENTNTERNIYIQTSNKHQTNKTELTLKHTTDMHQFKATTNSETQQCNALWSQTCSSN